MNSQQQEIKCRLCGGKSIWVFSKLLLKKHEAGFYRCEKCLSLQSEPPYWLDESYAEVSLVPDIRTLPRILSMRSLVFWLAKILKIDGEEKVLDWGGGNGMLVRFLRDLGLNAYRLDKYVKNLYALSFEHQENFRYKLVVAFQVWEHFVEPATDLDLLFGLQPEYVLITTGHYGNQGSDWEYLNAHGRHIFCYSGKGRDYIASKYGYHKIGAGDATLFCKNAPSKSTRQLMRLLFSSRLKPVLDVLEVLWPKNTALATRDREAAYSKFYDEGKVGSVNGP
jgi:hypothetical protein